MLLSSRKREERERGMGEREREIGWMRKKLLYLVSSECSLTFFAVLSISETRLQIKKSLLDISHSAVHLLRCLSMCMFWERERERERDEERDLICFYLLMHQLSLTVDFWFQSLRTEKENEVKYKKRFWHNYVNNLRMSTMCYSMRAKRHTFSLDILSFPSLKLTSKTKLNL